MNEKLRTGVELTAEEKAFVETLDSALNKMPTYQGDLQRSLYFYSDDDVLSFLKDYQVGNRVSFREYVSTTKGVTYNPEGQVQIFIKGAKNGRDISALNQKEAEVLYKRNSSFIVVDVTEKDGKHYILVVEDNE